MGRGIVDKKLPHIVFLFAVSAGIYIKTINGEFVSDDIYQVLQNPWIRDFSHLKEILFSSVWSFIPEGSGSKYYRPVMYLFYILGYQLSGSEPWGYHLIKILLHSASTIALFFLTIRILESASLKKVVGEKAYGLSTATAFFAALLFATHPVNSEAVAWVAALPELSFTLFCLLSFYFYTVRRYMLTALFFFLSLMSKETAIVLPLLLLAYNISFGSGFIGTVSTDKITKRYLPLCVAFALYLVLRFIAMGEVAPAGVTEKLLNGYEYSLNILPHIWAYMKKLVWPTDLVFFNLLRSDPVTSLLAIKSVVAIILSLVTLSILAAVRKVYPHIFLSATWIFLPVLPVIYSGWVSGFPLFAERYLYLSTAGFSLFVSFVAAEIFLYFRAGKGAAAVFLIVMLLISTVFSVMTVSRSIVWMNAFNLWQDGSIKAPANPEIRINYGNELAKRNLLNDALVEYKAALKLTPESASLHNGIGITYAKLGLFKDAVSEFEVALTLGPDREEEEAIRKNLEIAVGVLRGEGR